MLYEIQISTRSSIGRMTVVELRIDRPTIPEITRYMLEALEKNYDYLYFRLGLNRQHPDVQVFQHFLNNRPIPGDDSVRQAALKFFAEKRPFWKEKTIEYWSRHYDI